MTRLLENSSEEFLHKLNVLSACGCHFLIALISSLASCHHTLLLLIGTLLCHADDPHHDDDT